MHSDQQAIQLFAGVGGYQRHVVSLISFILEHARLVTLSFDSTAAAKICDS